MVEIGDDTLATTMHELIELNDRLGKRLARGVVPGDRHKASGIITTMGIAHLLMGTRLLEVSLGAEGAATVLYRHADETATKELA